MGHSRLELSTNKQNSKLTLKSFAENNLQQRLQYRRLLRARLGAGLTKWLEELDELEDDRPQPPGPKPSFDTYVSPAMKEDNRRAVEDYYSAVEVYAQALAEGLPEAKQNELRGDANRKKKALARTQKAWEVGEIAYGDQLGQWEASSSEHPKLAGQYSQQIAGFRSRLNAMIKVYNDRSKFDEDLEENDMDNFRTFDYPHYVPTHSFYNNAAGGTLFYDFQNNSFQIHFHCAKHAAKASATRVKLYGEEYGRNYDKAWGLAQHFMTEYPPNWTTVPRPL